MEREREREVKKREMDEQHRVMCVFVDESMTQAEEEGEGAWLKWRRRCVVIVVSALKKHEKTPENPIFHETSPQRVYFNDAVYFIGVQ